MHTLFERQVERQPDRPAVVHRDGVVTYHALNARAEQWASALVGAGVGSESLVGVHLGRTADLVAVLLGVLKVGGAYVPLDPAYPRERLDYMMADARLAALVTDDLDLGGPLPVLSPRRLPNSASRLVRPRRVPEAGSDRLAYVLYTSGTSGQPKGVGITHANAVDLLQWTIATFASDLDRVLATTSICFDCSILEIFGPLSWGGVAVLGQSPMDIGTSADGSRVRLLHTVPSVVDELLRTDRLPGSVRTAIVGGEALLPEVVQRIYRGSSIERLINLYGPTEYTSYATMAVIPPIAEPGPFASAPPIGRPVANTDIYLRDGATQAAPAEPGEIMIAGAGLARGYLGRAGLTAQRFVPEPFSGIPGRRMYATGDLGRYDDHGELAFLGRIDDQVKLRGVRIEPGEVEQALLAHPSVAEAAVSVAKTPLRPVLVAYVVPTQPGALRPEDLRSYLREVLPSPLVPEHFTELARLPRTPNGKLDRRALPEVTLPVAVPCASDMPSTSTDPVVWEPVLSGLWEEVLGVRRVAVDADILDIGGHSLAALRVRAKLSTLVGDEVPLRLLFDRPTVAQLAAELLHRYGPPPSNGPGGRGTTGPSDTPAGGSRLSATQAAILERTDAPLIPLVVRLTGPLRPAALGQALARLARRHAILRSVVRTGHDGTPQLVERPGHSAVALVDLTGVAVSDVDDVARQAAQTVLAGPARGGEHHMSRMAVLRLAPDDHVLALGLHPLAADAWSIEVVSHEILQGYAAARLGQLATGGEPTQYAEWAAQQGRRLDSPRGRAEHDYWRSRLSDLPTLRLCDDLGAVATVREPVRHYFAVPPATVSGIRQVGRTELATPYMVLVAGYAAVLHAWSGQLDFAVGCPVTGRVGDGMASVIGPCVDALVVRCDLSGPLTFRALLRQVRSSILDGFANGDVPFVRLAGEFADPKARHPLYQASIALQEWGSMLDPAYRTGLFARLDIGDVRISRFLDHTPATALDAELVLLDRDDDLEAVLDCHPDAVPAERVKQLADDYLDILDRAVRDPDLSLAELGIVARNRGGRRARVACSNA
jgi:amino acid adenylation domain-containing protein